MVRPKKTFQKHKFDFEVFREMGLEIEKFFNSVFKRKPKKSKMACVLENKCFFKSGY